MRELIALCLQQDLQNLHDWSLDNHLVFNISVSFSNKYSSAYSINFLHLPQLNLHCDLGVLLSTNLTWSTHSEHIIQG